MTVPVAWWPQIYAEFALSVTPAIGIPARPKAVSSFALMLAPTLGMVAAGKGVAAFGLSLDPTLGFSVPTITPASMVLDVSAQVGVGMLPGGHSPASFAF